MRKLITILALLAVIIPAASAQGNSVNVDMEVIKTEPVPLQTSEYAEVWLRVKNNGSATAENLELEYTPTFPFSVDPDEKTNWDIDRLLPGQSHHVHLQVRVDENAVHGSNDLKFRWSSGSGDIWIEEKVSVEVRTDDAALAVRSVDFPEKVGPGTSNPMTLELENLADSQLKNIDISLDLSDLPFAASDTTQKRVQKLGSGEVSETSFSLQVDESAENGVYRVPVTLEYENEAGTSFTRDLTTGVVVGGDSQLEVGVEERELMEPGNSGIVTLRIVNRGQGLARFVSMELEETQDYEVLSSPDIYLGNMQPDDYQTASFDLYAERAASSLEMPVRLEYKDASGVQREEVRQVSLELYTQDEMKRFQLSGGDNIILYAVAVLAVLAAAGLYWRRRKRNQV
ncbi:MAG: COG1361 S-layer family protein [Candidatus Nanohaloarchaeota archaeon QJJ-7]|nr:COG1361 S-layer family protein [Candidatus Nanohaloarchaeota archaeon QJJ-7]